MGMGFVFMGEHRSQNQGLNTKCIFYLDDHIRNVYDPDMSQESNDERPTTKVLLQLTDDLNTEVRRTASDLGLSLQNTIRLSLERGLPILRTQLMTPPTPSMAA